MEQIRRDVHEHIAEVMVEWQEITREEPWLSLPAEHRTDSLPVVVLALVDVALSAAPGRKEDEALVTAAVKHGHDREAQGFTQPLLFAEYHLLRTALWRYLRTRHAHAPGAMIGIDAAITVATSASLLGFHRDELEATGRWPRVVHALIDETPARLWRDRRDRHGRASGADAPGAAASH